MITLSCATLTFALLVGVAACASEPTGAPASGAATGAVQRCGWVDNPTPGNWSLTDRHGEWLIAAQGGYEAEGFEDMPDMSTRGWKVTNAGSHGYGCGCMTVTTNAADKSVVKIFSARPKPLRACRTDRKLPRRR